MNPKIKISIITVNFNNPSETVNCIRSFATQSKEKYALDFYVVDNASVDDQSRKLHKLIPQAEVIYSKKNLGFAGGNNLAIRRALKKEPDFILLINPDTLIKSKNFLTDMVSTGADIVAPIINYRQRGISVYDQGGKVDLLFGRNYHLVTKSKSKKIGKADYYSGACLLIKPVVFKKIGLLDDSYFLYYEDADFCLRAVHAGFVLRLSRDAVVFHYLSTTTSKIGKRKLLIIANSHWRFCRSHLPQIAIPFWGLFNQYLRIKSLFP